jgi:hypothetical protein
VNIQTTKLPVANGVSNNKSAAPAAADEKSAAQEAAAPQESFTPAAEGEGRGSAAWRGAIRKGVSWGNTLEKPLGGMTAIGLAIGSGLALSLGGAMVGGLVGGSFGSAVGALQADGPISFITGTFGNMGSAISIGSTIGSVAGLVGGGALGLKIGGTVAKGIAFVPGAVVGAVQGAVNPSSIPPAEQKEDQAPKHQQELRGIFKGGAKVGGGVGLLAGAAGGFVTGATLTAAGSLITDVAQGDFSMSTFVSQLGSTALIGGGIAALGGAAIGAAGGEMVFGKAPQFIWDKTAGKFTANQPGIQERIDKREVELGERQEKLTVQAENLARETSGYRERHAETSEGLVKREDQMAADEKQVAGDLKTIDTRIEDNATADYEKRSATPDANLDAAGNHGIIGERSSLDAWDTKLQGWNGELNNFRSDLINWEKKLDHKIDVEAGTIFGEERKPIDKQFAEMHGKLDAFESRLNTYETDINDRIQSKYESGIAAEKPGVDADLRDARREKERSEEQLRDAQSDKSRAQSQYDSAQRSRDSARSRLRNAESEESSLRSRISSLNSRISSLQSQISSCRSSL